MNKEQKIVSNCCWATIQQETFCGSCKEHCGWVCETCEKVSDKYDHSEDEELCKCNQ